jgi:hypothetical protein
VTRKRAGKNTVIFEGSTIPGQSITGDTGFKSGDVFTIKETASGKTAKIKVR